MAPPKKRTKEEAYADFMTSIASDVKDAEEREQEEATKAAQDREAREAFEQRCAPDDLSYGCVPPSSHEVTDKRVPSYHSARILAGQLQGLLC